MIIAAPAIIIPPEKPAIVRAYDLKGLPGSPQANFPFPFFVPRSKAPTLVPAGTGTAIGNLTGNSGLAGIFDGNTNQSSASAATGGGATSPYAGKTWPSAKIMSSVQVWGANDQGYINIAGNCRLDFYGKQGAAPSNGTNGTIIGTTGTFTNALNANTKTITSTDTATLWDHNWVLITPDGQNSWFAEMQFTELA